MFFDISAKSQVNPLMKTTPGLCLQVILTDSLAVLTQIL